MPIFTNPDAQALTNRQETSTIERPVGWKHKEFCVGSVHIPSYASPNVQVLLIAIVCFLCPGMFNALSGLGGGGQVDHKVANDANTALNATFSVVGFFAGTLTNVLGIRISAFLGGMGYSVYIASFLCYSHTQNYGFTVSSGVLLGVSAGLLWTAQGAILMAYPPEQSKGKYISWFWMVFNMGAVLGSFIPLSQNIHVQESKTVTDGTYIAFIILTLLGAALAAALLDAKHVIRKDGSRVILMKNPTWKTELWGLYETFKTDPYICFLFPMFFASNWYYTYIFNDFNGVRFNTRTRALNNCLYYCMEIFGAFIYGYALDQRFLKRTTKAKLVWIVLIIMTMVIWGGSYAFQRNYTRADTITKDAKVLDWKDSGYIGPMVLYMSYGFFDAGFSTSIYWFMGSLTNNGRKLANFAGFFKGVQSAGAAIAWRLDNANTSYINTLASCWALLSGSLFLALPVILLKIKDHGELEEDLKFSDEVLEDVIPLGVLGQQHTDDVKIV